MNENKLSLTLQEACDEVAMKLLGGLAIFGVTEYNYRKKIGKLKEEISNELMEKYGIATDLSEIHLDSRIGKSTLWEWAKRQDKKTKVELFKRFDEEYKNCFREKYLKSIFSMNTVTTDECLLGAK